MGRTVSAATEAIMNLEIIQLSVILALAVAFVEGTDSGDHNASAGYYHSDYLHYQESNTYYKVHAPSKWRASRDVCLQEGATLPFYFSIRHRMVLLHVQLQSVNTTSELKLWLSAESPAEDKDFAQENRYLSVKGLVGSAPVGTELSFVCVKEPVDCDTTAVGYTPGPDGRSCYKFHVGATPGKTWMVAFQTCESEGAHLAIINSLEEKQYIVEFGRSQTNKTLFAVGFHSLFVKGTLHAVDGKRFPLEDLVNTSIYGGHCGFVLIHTGLLCTVTCDSTQGNFVCEKEARKS